MKTKPFIIQKGLTIVEVLAVIFVLFILVAVTYPVFFVDRVKVNRIGCANNLKQIELAFKTWSLPCGDGYPMNHPSAEGGSMEFVGAGETFAHFRAISNELSNPKLLICPGDPTHKAATNFQSDLDDSKITYFVSMDASDRYPAGLFVGDSHLAVDGAPVKSGMLLLKARADVSWTLARHNGEGNVGLADGSVHQVTAAMLKKLMIDSEVPTNRLSIP